MGAGSALAGLSPAGADTVAAPSARPVFSPPGAAIYFLQTKEFRLKTDGTFYTADWVDQAAELALGVGLGQIGSVPDMGNRLRRIARLNPATIQREVEDAVTDAWAFLISPGYLSVERIVAQIPGYGQLIVAATYLNLRALNAKPQTVTRKAA